MFIRTQKLQKKYVKKVRGVGINDSYYNVYYNSGDGKTYKCPYYARWEKMLERCYCPKYQKKEPSYKGCSVSSKWLFFSNFMEWMESQDWKGKHLDKDILYPGNKIYSSETCIFVDRYINNVTISPYQKKGDFPLGVFYKKEQKAYCAQISDRGKRRHLGYFDTPIKAHIEYLKARIIYLRLIASEQIDRRIKNGLMGHANKTEIELQGILT